MNYSDPVITNYITNNYSPEVTEEINNIFNLLIYFNVDMHDLRDNLYQYILDDTTNEPSYNRFMFSNVITEECTDIINSHGVYLKEEIGDITVYKVVLNTLKMLQETEEFYALSSIVENTLTSKRERFIELVSYYNNIDNNTFIDYLDRITDGFFNNVTSFIKAKEEQAENSNNNIEHLNKIRGLSLNFKNFIKKNHEMFIPVGLTLLEDYFPIDRGCDYYLRVIGVSYINEIDPREVSTAYNTYSLALLITNNHENMIKATDSMSSIISEDKAFNYRVSQHIREIDFEFNKYLKGLNNEKI